MAMYFYASKISAIACGMRCKQTVLQKSRGQRDRDKCRHRRRRRCRHPSSSSSSDSDDCCLENEPLPSLEPTNGGIFSLDAGNLTAETALLGVGPGALGIRYRRRHSAEQLSAYDLEMGFQQIELAAKSGGHNRVGVGDDVVQYDVPKNRHKRSQCDINFESSVLGSGGIMYINGRIVSGPLDSLVETLIPKNVIDLDKKKWDQPSTSGGPPGAQDPKKTCNLETYLDWSARLRLFVCNEILQCGGIEDRSRTVERWSGVAQYCLLVGNYNSATAILESLESPAIARLKITWSKLQVTCQQLDCMQRHAEGHGHLWQKQAIVLNEQGQPQSLKTDKQAKDKSSTSIGGEATSTSTSECGGGATTSMDLDERPSTSASVIGHPVGITGTSAMNAMSAPETATLPVAGNSNAEQPPTSAPATPLTGTALGKPNDWVVIPVFADIVKLALGERENCLQRLQNGHINMVAFDRMAAIVGAFTKHMQAMKTAQTPSSGEYEHFCRHMQQTTKLGEAELMMASFDCEEPNNAEKLMYDLN
ncbi:uncharacterized protein LOC117900609 isoform X6 [Drosophila subobscura]|uniref:uncharacterized protein LOC117900609 isoform X6 n=1 Tax=Drosophila subobscura TaxID=7241 RepID=UPI00155AD754|nr:uncharacterized protein LOC117900609 isoform X6 [Drosophila subobscura]